MEDSMTFLWKKFERKLEGEAGSVIPDRSVPETVPKGFPSWLIWARVLWLRLFVWNLCAVFRVPERLVRRGYHVAYKPIVGPAMMTVRKQHNLHFRMMLGAESCGFFIVDENGEPHPVEIIAEQVPKHGTVYSHFKLH